MNRYIIVYADSTTDGGEVFVMDAENVVDVLLQSMEYMGDYTSSFYKIFNITELNNKQILLAW